MKNVIGKRFQIMTGDPSGVTVIEYIVALSLALVLGTSALAALGRKCASCG